MFVDEEEEDDDKDNSSLSTVEPSLATSSLWSGQRPGQRPNARRRPAPTSRQTAAHRESAGRISLRKTFSDVPDVTPFAPANQSSTHCQTPMFHPISTRRLSAYSTPDHHNPRRTIDASSCPPLLSSNHRLSRIPYSVREPARYFSSFSSTFASIGVVHSHGLVLWSLSEGERVCLVWFCRQATPYWTDAQQRSEHKRSRINLFFSLSLSLSLSLSSF
jgi:hypothetical protein